MGFFSLTQELAIDLGTANTLIIYNGKVVVDEPSIVALDVHTGKVVAIGQQARQMHEKTNPNIKTIRPLKDGVIADFNATELMLRGMIKKVKTSGSLFAPSLRMVICIPSGSTNVEIRAVRDSAEHAGGREVYMIYEPMAAALGAEMGCTRPVAEEDHLLPTSRYIGVSGVTVRPEVYFAVGLSGQVQHTAGCSQSGLIFAVNNDENAPIFKECDFGVIGDLNNVIPKLIDALENK